MLLQTEGGIWAEAEARVFKLLMGPNRTQRRMLAADRTIAKAHQRIHTLRKLAEARDARAEASARRAVEREFEPAWGRMIRMRGPKKAAANFRKADKEIRRKARAATSRRAIRAYRTPLKDSRGRIALYFRVRYVGFKSKNWRPGLAADHAIYILREEALENGEAALNVQPLISNMGESADEIAACWNALEKIEEAYRANAKVQYRIIWNLPHNLTAEQRRDLVEAFCERTFGRLGLPYVAAIHKADERGDERNYHAHVLFSTRPVARVKESEWDFAQEKVNGLTDEAGLYGMRALAAGHMNGICREAGLDVRFSHMDYRKRGINAQRQEHVGPQRMAAHERGESVAVIERNAKIVEQNELAVSCDAANRQLTLSEQLSGLLNRSLQNLEQRRMIAATRAKVQAIAAAARRFSLVKEHDRPAVDAELVRTIALRAGVIAQRLEASRIQPPPVGIVAGAVATRARAICDAIASIEARRVDLDLPRAFLTGLRGRIEQHHNRVREENLEAARALVLGSPHFRYATVDGKIRCDLSRMPPDEATLVRSLEPDDFKAAVRERVRQDRERAASQERLRREEEEERRRTQLERQRLVEEACRLIHEKQTSFYRIGDNKVHVDFHAFSKAEVALLKQVGTDEPALHEAVRQRIAKDGVARRERDVPPNDFPNPVAVPAGQTDPSSDAVVARMPPTKSHSAIAAASQGGVEDVKASQDAGPSSGPVDEAVENLLPAGMRNRSVGDRQEVARLQALEDLFTTVEDGRRYLVCDDGRRVVPEDLLEQFGVSATDISMPEVQARLQRIALQQEREISKMTAHVSLKPEQLRKEGRYWLLDGDAPEDIENLVYGWHREPRVQALLEKTRKAALASGASVTLAEEYKLTDTRWYRAKHLRERLMAESSDHERLDGREGIQKPLQPRRPGQQVGRSSERSHKSRYEVQNQGPDR